MSKQRRDAQSYDHTAPGPVRAAFKLMGAVAPGPTAKLAGSLFSRPPRRSLRRAEAAGVEDAHRFTLEVDPPHRLDTEPLRLAAWSWGDGPTVLLHHGWGGRGPQLSAFAQPLVEAGFSVVAYDAAAHGESSGRMNTLIDMAATLRHVARRLNGLTAVIAHSMGGPVTAYALQHGLQLDRAVFLSPPGDMEMYSRMFAHAIGFGDSGHDRMVRRFEEFYQMRWQDMDAEHLCFGQETPLLHFHDTEDADVPLEQGRRWADAWPGCEHVLTEGLGHRRILWNEDVVKRVVGFVSSGEALPQGCRELADVP